MKSRFTTWQQSYSYSYICFVEFTKIYARLNIENLVDRGESYYQDKMAAIVKIIEEKGDLCYVCCDNFTPFKSNKQI